MSRIKVAIHGAAGRMGQRLVALGIADPELQIAAALEAPLHPRLGQDAGLIAGVGEIGVPLAAVLEQPVDVVIDFSVPAGALAITATCMERGLPLVVATTGLSDSQQEMLRQASARISLLWSPNMSLAVNLTMKLAEVAAQALAVHPSGADVEIIERHHRFKEDAPSGTALKFGRIVAAAMGHTAHRHGREGIVGKRPHAEIGYHAVRIGDNPGEHTIVFGLLGETIELTVRATSRDCYAHGALTAAKFLVGKPAALYGMADVLHLQSIAMAKCEEGYLCDICGGDVDGIAESDLYLRYVIGMVDPETLHTTRERHIRCNPALAQFIVDDDFPPVVADGDFDKRRLDAAYVKQRQTLVTRGWRRLRELAGLELPILDYPLPEVRAEQQKRSR